MGGGGGTRFVHGKIQHNLVSIFTISHLNEAVDWETRAFFCMTFLLIGGGEHTLLSSMQKKKY